MRSWTSALIVLLGGSLVLAGGPEPGVRRHALGECGNGEPCIAEAVSAGSPCDFADRTSWATGSAAVPTRNAMSRRRACSPASWKCRSTRTAPTGFPAHVSRCGCVARRARASASKPPPRSLDFCDVDVETPCTSGGTERYTTPFFCSNDRDDVLPEFLQESMLPTADWLVLHPLPASIARTVRAAFGAPGVPVVMRTRRPAAPTRACPIPPTACR